MHRCREIATALALLLAASGCTGSAPAIPVPGQGATGTAHAGAERWAAAEALSAFAASVPPVRDSGERLRLDQATAEVLNRAGPAEPVGAWSSAQVQQARAVLAAAMAASHADSRVLCSREQPLDKYVTADVKRWVRESFDNEQSYQALQRGLGSCSSTRFVGPHVVVGPHRLKAGPDRLGGLGLSVDFQGWYGYVLVDEDGRAEPYVRVYGGTYDLVRVGSSWKIAGWDDHHYDEDEGWHSDMPLPDGYLPDVEVPDSDPEALGAVRRGVAALEAVPLVQGRFTPWDADPLKVLLRPATGEALLQDLLAASGAEDLRAEIVYDRSQHFALLDDDADPLAGERLDGLALFRQREPERQVRMSTNETDSNPYAWLSLLAQADSAAWSPCRAGVGGSRCAVVLIGTALPDPGVATRLLSAARHNGRAAFEVVVGLSDDGLLTGVHHSWQERRLGVKEAPHGDTLRLQPADPVEELDMPRRPQRDQVVREDRLTSYSY